MSLDEFRLICNELFELIPIAENEHKEGQPKYKRRLFPSGCDECKSENEWDCFHYDRKGNPVVCAWRENHWKYEEMKSFLALEKAQRGGLNINRIESLTYIDYIKLGILKEYL